MARYASSLLINVNDLLHLQGVEKQKVEFKKAWHGKQGPRGTYWQVVHTICAYANDFFNDNGGYIIIGVDEKETWEDSDDRQVNYPPVGVSAKDLERIQREILGACRAQIKPDYHPVLSPEMVECPDGIRKHVLVIWAMASDNKPHTCKENEKGRDLYYVRQGTETKMATPVQIEELLRQGNKIPFDDRRAIDYECGRQLSEGDIDLHLVKKFLKDVQSKMLEHEDKEDSVEFYMRMRLLRRVGDKRSGDHLLPVWVPRNVAILFFHPTPHEFLRGARTEIAIYSHDDVTDEVPVTGPIDHQIDTVLSIIVKRTKEDARYEFVAYPERALREAVVNAFHHRGYPGPSPTLTKEHFTEGSKVPEVPSRNRRIAEFLKERKLAEARFTGVRTIFKSMKQNKNPMPSFDFDPTHFRVRLPGHPKHTAYSILRDVNTLCAKGEKDDAVKLLMGILDGHLQNENPVMCSDMLICKLLELYDDDISHPDVQPYERFISEKLKFRIPLISELCKWCVADEMPDISIGVTIVKELVLKGATNEDLQSAISKAVSLCQERSEDGRPVLESIQNAHKLFEAMGDVTQTNSYVAFQFACCKFDLYINTINQTDKCRYKQQEKHRDRQADRHRKDLIPYLKEAEDYVYKAIQLTNEEYKRHHAMQYRQLGYIHSQLYLIKKSTVAKITAFYDNARKYNPKIKISRVFIPPEYQSRYMPTSPSLESQLSDTSFEW
ncbi:hypothetical protein AWC38_SpisGene11649 [Stylophora pistillata]|uniref:Schlafen AlbA-2 domain-containing protein n=1 Tax=Stylophora pistillata TaxID=50429 RepID=A0A2B4S5E0_STYPI|nr:hypothetical protein AWC38_SpisGene11649 [Stylophora pistillata]